MVLAALATGGLAGCGDDVCETESETEITGTSGSTSATEPTSTGPTTSTGEVTSTTAGTAMTDPSTSSASATETTGTTETTGNDFMCLDSGELCFVYAFAFLEGARVGALELGELVDGGALDVVVGLEDGYQIWSGAGGGSFTETPKVLLDNAVLDIVVADLDGDGDNDIAFTQSASDSVEIHINEDGLFFPNDMVSVVGFPRALAITDVNNDMNLDLVVAAELAGGVNLLIGSGDATFSNSVFTPAGSAPLSLVLAPFSGGIFDDMLVANFGGDTIGYYPGEMNGFGDEKGVGMIAGPRALAVGDFDNDFNLDYAVSGEGNDAVGVALGTGVGTFDTLDLFAAGLDPRALVAADFNNDLALDVAVANRGGDDVTVLLGDGTGKLGVAQPVYSVFEPSALAVADLNGDGGPDLVIASDGAVAGGVTVIVTKGA